MVSLILLTALQSLDEERKQHFPFFGLGPQQKAQGSHGYSPIVGILWAAASAVRPVRKRAVPRPIRAGA